MLFSVWQANAKMCELIILTLVIWPKWIAGHCWFMLIIIFIIYIVGILSVSQRIIASMKAQHLEALLSVMWNVTASGRSTSLFVHGSLSLFLSTYCTAFALVGRLPGAARWLDVSCTVHLNWQWSRNGRETLQTSLFSNYHCYNRSFSRVEAQFVTVFSVHTYAFNSPFSRSTWVSQYQKGKTNLDFTEARDSGWQWHQLGHMQVCTSLQMDNYASTPPLNFLQSGCLSATQPTASKHPGQLLFTVLSYNSAGECPWAGSSMLSSFYFPFYCQFFHFGYIFNIH